MGVYLFFASSATKLHFFLGVFLHFITGADRHHSEETSYYISSRDACPRLLMDLAREHWKIESMHWMLDVTFSEDSCRFLSENPHKTLNSLRKFALALHKHFLSATHKKSSIKSSLLSALLRTHYLYDVLRFL
ncbi:MAG: ISAs1 family transposase [Oscillospiraceae bacterium]|nr:ISAs1 family transposase [Oscillospiraceae bacterium]